MVLRKLAIDFLSKIKLNLNQALYTNASSLWIQELSIKFKTRETLEKCVVIKIWESDIKPQKLLNSLII